jgi:osmotically-inducible protein OsmY
MNKNRHLHLLQTALLLTGLLLLSGCTAIIDGATNKPIETDPGKRSFGTYLDDENLELIAGVNIRKADPYLKLAHVNVTSFNNIILLTGQVPTVELKLLAEKTAAKVNTVRKVYNELQIKGNTALLVRTNDTWLGAKVKTAFIGDKMISSSKIKTVVEDSVLYLMGLSTKTQADYITEVSSNIAGIQEVVRVFEYID